MPCIWTTNHKESHGWHYLKVGKYWSSRSTRQPPFPSVYLLSSDAKIPQIGGSAHVLTRQGLGGYLWKHQFSNIPNLELGDRKQPRSSGHDGDIGRNASLPHTTQRRTRTNLKTKNNQNCQIFKLHGRATTLQLKKHSSRLVGGAELGSRGGEDAQPRRWLMDQLVPHSWADKLGGTIGKRDRPQNTGFQHGKLKTQNPWM